MNITVKDDCFCSHGNQPDQWEAIPPIIFFNCWDYRWKSTIKLSQCCSVSYGLHFVTTGNGKILYAGIVLLNLETVLCHFDGHIFSLNVRIERQSNSQPAPFWLQQRSRVDVLLRLLCQFTVSDKEVNYQEYYSCSFMAFLMKTSFILQNWMHVNGLKFFGATIKWPKLFKCNTKVAATSFSREKSIRTRRVFRYSPLTTPLSHSLSKTVGVPEKSLHKAATQYNTIHRLNNVNNAAILCVRVGLNVTYDWYLKGALWDAIHT